LINGIGNGILISVHQNTYPDPRPSGTAVLYGSVPDSDLLALRLQQNLITQLCPENRRVAAPIPDRIYLMKHVRCPAVLVECGFLSNPAEAEKLKTDRYQTQIALVMIATYLQFTG
jgi:N-acetylmuramoyl-L-alanine amidase